MIHHVPEQYTMTCDGCGCSLTTYDTYLHFIIYEGERKHIREVATDYGWVLKRNKDMCPDCFNKQKLKQKTTHRVWAE